MYANEMNNSELTRTSLASSHIPLDGLGMKARHMCPMQYVAPEVTQSQLHHILHRSRKISLQSRTDSEATWDFVEFHQATQTPPRSGYFARDSLLSTFDSKMPSHWSARRLVENVLEVIPTAIVTNSLQRTWSIVDCETYHQYANLLLDKGVTVNDTSQGCAFYPAVLYWFLTCEVLASREILPGATRFAYEDLGYRVPMKWRCRWGRMRDPENREPRGLLQDPSHAPAAAAAAVAVRGLQPKPESDPRWRTRPSGCGWTLEKHSHIPRG
ncbi:Uncharacterized protein HZ326_23562 [Fusarium oxysporum f. sp. albedinis]|nr:Uncharacterized protein HZ326_23562 [Fusarium oxysporum f. sp. albedinis]